MTHPFAVSALPITGVASIDAQHRELLALFDRLDAGIRSGAGRGVLEPLLDGLVAAVAAHCAHEEEILARAGYADLARQQERHRGFNRKFAEMATAYRRGDAVLGPEVSRVLVAWVMEHVRREDAAYIPCLRAAGLTGS